MGSKQWAVDSFLIFAFCPLPFDFSIHSYNPIHEEFFCPCLLLNYQVFHSLSRKIFMKGGTFIGRFANTLRFQPLNTSLLQIDPQDSSTDKRLKGDSKTKDRDEERGQQRESLENCTFTAKPVHELFGINHEQANTHENQSQS